MRRWFTLALLLVVTGVAIGGDIATFENLGFSRTADTFVFAQYGVGGAAGNPYAEIYVVDVPGNVFVSNGIFRLTSDAPLTLGQDGRGALYTVLGRARTLIASRDVDHLTTGRPVYILVDGDEPRERLAFRDFHADARYEVRLSQQRRGEGDGVSAAFHIDLTITRADDTVRTMRIGRPSLFRDGVTSYRITQIVVGPDEASVVFVVERRSPDGSVRYMVETAAF